MQIILNLYMHQFVDLKSIVLKIKINEIVNNAHVAKRKMKERKKRERKDGRNNSLFYNPVWFLIGQYYQSYRYLLKGVWSWTELKTFIFHFSILDVLIRYVNISCFIFCHISILMKVMLQADFSLFLACYERQQIALVRHAIC